MGARVVPPDAVLFTKMKNFPQKNTATKCYTSLLRKQQQKSPQYFKIKTKKIDQKRGSEKRIQLHQNLVKHT